MFAVFHAFTSYSSSSHTSLARVQGFSLLVTTQNSTALKVNGMKEDIFVCNSFWLKKVFVPGQKKSMFTSTIFLTLFSCHQEHTNPTTLMDAKQYALVLLLFLLSMPFVFDNLRTT